MYQTQWNPTERPQPNRRVHSPAWVARLQRNRQIRAAVRASYEIWLQRYDAQRRWVLSERDLQTQILPRVCAVVAENANPSPVDAVEALAHALRGCTGSQCSSFAQFAPELADYVCLFEKALYAQTARNRAI